MKTKISHLGRSTVSVILAVMMLLSTMLIGTVSTVNAVTKTFEAVYLVGNINGNDKWNSTEYPFIFDETTDNWYLDITITQSSEFKARVNNKWDISFGASNGGNCTISETGDYRISVKDGAENGTDLKVEKTVNKVADSVTLTASSTSVKVGTEVTLTASLNDKATGLNDADVTYKFKRTNGDEVTGSTTDGNTYKFTPATAGDYTFEVTASAENYTSVTNTVTVTATSDSSAETTQPVTGEYYFWYSTNDDIGQYSVNWKAEPMIKNGSSYYVSNLPANVGSNFYFIVNKNADIPYRNTVWKTKNDVTVDCSTCAGNFSSIGPQERYVPKESDSTQSEPVYFYRISVKTNGSYSFTFDGNKTVTVTEGSIQPPDPTETVKITVPTVENAKVTAVANNSTTYNEGESFDIKVGSSFTVNVEGENNYTLNNITYGTQSKTETVANFTAESNETTFSVVMNPPVSDPVTVTLDSDNNGTVSAIHNGLDFASGGKVNVGDTVTIKATPSGSNYIFKSWSIDGDYDIKDSKTTSDAEITIVVKSNITATASFTETSPYQVAYGSKGTLMRMNKTKYDGVYISTGTIVPSPDNDKNPASHFTIYDTANNQYASISAKGYYWLKDENPSITMGDNDSWINNYTDGSDKGLINNACKSVQYVVYNAKTKTITLTGDPDYGTKATLYVKNGTYSTSFTTGATKDYAGSSVAAGLATTKTDPCNTYSVDLDTNVNIQTTLNETYRKAGYYVAAYSVNGRNYPASAKNADQGIYQANITITEDLAENCVVEVTPIYYNRTIEKEDNYITFYVDAERLVGGWGSTVAIYAYAYEGGTAQYGSDGKPTNNVNLLGAYPGQPMVKDGQYYVAKIPRYNYKISSDGSLKIDKTSPVAGITLNNYYNETVHNSLVPIKRNMQTYDFSDFVALANKKDVKTIMFQSKFYNATGDAKRNTKVIYGYDTEISDPTKAVQSISNIANANVNPYEDFTDYYGRATDAIGNLLNDDQKADKDNLYIISTGSYNNQSSDYSTKGQWVTIWNVYDHSGNLITYGTPADFLNENTTQYKAIAEKYSGKPVKISYEKGLSYDNGVTSRTDGRWYYSTLGQEFTSDVAIEYKDKDGTYTADTNTNTDNTGFIGQTSGATATINNVTTASFTSVTDTAHLNIKVANGWRFDGWFIKQGDKYTKVSDNYTDISTDVLMSNSYHIVARVSEIPTGTLELNHTAYTGTDPAAHTGTGFYYISAVVKKADNSKIEFAETQGKISIDNFAANDSLEITLKAKCHGDNTVFALYKGEAGGYTEIGTGLNGKSEFTYKVTVSAGSLFENGKLAVNALNYYTDIVKVGGTCDITYMYKDRFGVEGEDKMVSYVVRNVELSTYEITHDYIPTDETITKYAPRIDTMYVETKWNLKNTDKVKKGKSQATVIATQTPKTCDVYYPNKDGEYYTEIKIKKTVDYNTLFKDDNGNFILSAPETDGNGNQFSYWDVYKADKTGDNTGELVTKCYERNFGLRIMADYYIEPVYDGKAPTLTANINSPVLNREIYGDSANPTDKLYVDLLTAFTSTAIPTFKENTTPLKVECGVFVVRNNTKTLSVDDRNNLVNAAISNSTDTTSDILLKGYIRDSAVEEGLITKLRDLAKDSNVKDKTNTVANFGNDEYRITKLVFDNNSLTNKNRIDEVLKYTNNTANQNYIFTAYAFVVIKDSHGTVQEMQISNPQYYNLCYVGNKALDNN